MTTVLIVMNDQACCSLLAETVEYEGYKSLLSDTATQAYSIMRDHPEPLIVAYYDCLFDAFTSDILQTVATSGPAMQRHAFINLTCQPLSNLPNGEAYRSLLAQFSVPRIFLPYIAENFMPLVRILERHLLSRV